MPLVWPRVFRKSVCREWLRVALAAEPGNVAGAVVNSARRGLSYDRSPEDHTMHLAENLVALHVFVDLGAAFDGGLRPGNHRFVIGVTAAEGSCRLVLLFPGLSNRLVVNRPETLSQLWWVSCMGDGQHQCRRRGNQHLIFFHVSSSFAPVDLHQPGISWHRPTFSVDDCRIIYWNAASRAQ